jgi:uncharacterized protein
MRRLFAYLLCWLVSACATIQIDEAHVIHPDSVSGAAPRRRLTEAALQTALPDAHMDELEVAGPAGAPLRGVLIRRPQARTTVLYFGGNGFHLDDGAMFVATALAPCPVNLLVFDYPGYGRSPGSPTVATMQQDALTLFDYAAAQFPGGLFVHGHSLGSFVASHVAQQRPVRGLVLEAPATRALDWAQAKVPWYATPFVNLQVSDSLQDVDNTRALARFEKPTLVLAASGDAVIPHPLARKVYDAIPGTRKQFLLVSGADHNNILQHPEAAAAYCAFLQQNTGLATSH